MFSFVPGKDVNLIVKRNIRGNLILFHFALKVDDNAAGKKRPVCLISSQNITEYIAVNCKSCFCANLV